MNYSRILSSLFLSFSLLTLVLQTACIPPADLIRTSGCRLKQPLTKAIPPHAKILVQVGSPISLADELRADLANPSISSPMLSGGFGLAELEAALIEALATRQGLLVDVIGWPELQAYQAHLETKQRNQSKEDWEFGTGDTGHIRNFNLRALADQETLASATHVVEADVTDDSTNSEYHSGNLRVSTRSATVNARLVDRATGEVLMVVSIPTSGDQLFQKAARRFAMELETQFWESREGKSKADSGL